MRLRRAAVVALSLVAVVATGAGLPGARAQAECDVTTSDGLEIRICSPRSGSVATTSEVPVLVEVVNRTTRPFVGPYDVTTITATVVLVDPDRPGQQLPDPNVETVEGGDEPQLSLSWSPTFPTNGPYELRVEATGSAPGGQSGAATSDFALAVPPARPTGVKATATSDGSVRVSWSIADAEPDLVAYEVQRAAQGTGGFTTVSNGVVRSMIDEVLDSPGPGAWRYQVLAIRRGAGSSDGVSSSPSTSAAAEVPESTPTTQGDAAGGASGGGDGGDGDAVRRTGETATPTTDGVPSGRAATPGITTGGRSTVDISGLLGSRRTTPTTLRRPAEPDPGFQDTLPFDVEQQEEAAPEVEPLELGADDPQALGEQLTSDPGERRRSLGFVAGGLLLFVLGFTGLFLRSEVRRADDLDALDPAPPAPEPDPSTQEPRARRRPRVPLPVAAAGDIPAGVGDVAAPTRRRRRPEALGPLAAEPVVDPVRRRRPPRLAPATVSPAVVEGETVAEPARRPRRRTAVRDVLEPEPARGAAEPRLATEAAIPLVQDVPAPERRSTRAQVRAARNAELEALFSGDDGPTTADDDARHLAALRPAQSTTTASPSRVRRTVAPVDAPGLDVPEPEPDADPDKARPHARRASHRLPSRPADDRREGGPAVRPRGRGTGQGNRRVPVG